MGVWWPLARSCTGGEGVASSQRGGVVVAAAAAALRKVGMRCSGGPCVEVSWWLWCRLPVNPRGEKTSLTGFSKLSKK